LLRSAESAFMQMRSSSSGTSGRFSRGEGISPFKTRFMIVASE
jgi:hypothetical protein